VRRLGSRRHALEGILLEDGDVSLRPEAVAAIRTLDERGILHSIASRNEPEPALAKLEELGLLEYFLHPRIGWTDKSRSVRAVAKALDLGLDTFAFVDDQPFEREEVASALPQVLVLDAADVADLPGLSRMDPGPVTEDSRQRRTLYRQEMARQVEEEEHAGTREDFLATLDLRFRIFVPGEDDLDRASELTVRTNQLNTTGVTYGREELTDLIASDRHTVLMASLEDRFGTYGRIGLTILEHGDEAWTIRLLLMSCRVVSRGVGTVLLNHLMERARDAGVRLRALLAPNDRNRMMVATYAFAGFEPVGREGGFELLESDLSRIQACPEWVRLEIGDSGM
jgi:FkbH-like protein